MGECNNEKKRVRNDSEENSPESKFLRLDSVSSDTNSSESNLKPGNSVESRELGRVDSDESALNSPVVSEFQDDFLNMFDEAVNETEGFDFVIKSFEEEILTPSSGFEPFSAEFKPNLVYLLEASDDELGLPPTVTEERRVEIAEPGSVGPERFDSTGFLGLEDDVRSLSDEAFGFGKGVVYDGYYGENGGSYVTVDGLFDYSETTEILWRCESLQAM
ncbi:unnamed protein product [Lupinus luteus]|uniref:Uncharacterized protein n=1 Tax=Lupinus luteus TaxID=3873 RepID=A0AAV1WWZ9_LUPLU